MNKTFEGSAIARIPSIPQIPLPYTLQSQSLAEYNRIVAKSHARKRDLRFATIDRLMSLSFAKASDSRLVDRLEANLKHSRALPASREDA